MHIIPLSLPEKPSCPSSGIPSPHPPIRYTVYPLPPTLAPPLLGLRSLAPDQAVCTAALQAQLTLAPARVWYEHGGGGVGTNERFSPVFRILAQQRADAGAPASCDIGGRDQMKSSRLAPVFRILAAPPQPRRHIYSGKQAQLERIR